MLTPLLQSLAYGWRRLCSRKLYIAAMVVVPVAFAIFFVDLMKEGLPLKVPVSVVDLDQSQLSRRITRNLNATELIDITHRDLSYSEALDRVRRGETFGFFLIPRDFQRDAISGGDATLTFYSDMTVFVPGTLAFKGFKTQAVTTAGGLAATKLTSLGIGDDAARALIQPVVINSNPIGNPWLNYLIYLANSFIPSVLSLMALLLTAYTICDEIKCQTSPQWLHTAGGSMTIALAGKLIPQWAIMTIVGFFCQSVIYGYCNCPLNCPLWHMLLAMALMVMGSQAFAVTICCAVPAALAEHLLADRHPHLLHSGLLIPGVEHVPRRRHLQLHTADALLLPHLCRPGSQRHTALLFEMVLCRAAHVPDSGPAPPAPAQETLS